MIQLILIHTQEWLRQKFFHVVFLLAIIFVLFSSLLGSLSFTEQERIVTDFGLAAIELFLVFICSFIAATSIHKDAERKTLYLLLARPLQRWQILLSYFLSVGLLSFLTLTVLSVTLFLTINLQSYFIVFIFTCFTIYLKSLIIASIAFLFSLLARPMFAFVLSIISWIVSYSVNDIVFFVKKTNPEQALFLNKSLDLIFPQFYKYNWKSLAFIKSIPDLSVVSWSLYHSILWIIVTFLLAQILFKRKQFG